MKALFPSVTPLPYASSGLWCYDTSVTPDAAHGKPVTAPFADGETAISLILAGNGAATVPSYYSGSMDFAANQVAFHTLGGIPFTVTYTAKSPTG
jgi:hypothetical protein